MKINDIINEGESEDEFRRKLLRRVQDRVNQMRADVAIAKAQGKFLWKVDDVIYSPKTGKTFTVVDYIVQKDIPKYIVTTSDGNSQLIADIAHKTLHKINEDIQSDEKSIVKETSKLDELKCWTGYTRVRGVPAGKPGSCKKKVNEQGVAEGLEHNSQDLADVADWMNTTPDKLSVTVKQEPIEKFIKQIREMYGTYDEFPEDEKRTNRILKLLKSGANPLPIYVEAGDPYLFVMEGRHRMVAFWLAEMKSIPVAYVSVKDQQGVSEDITPDNNLKIDNHVESSFINGYNGLIIAHYNDKYAGYLRYHVYNDVPKIEMIYVNQDYRRRGIAMSMLKALQQLTPNEEIDWGYTTDYGTKLKQSIDFKKLPNTDIIKKKAKLAGLKSKLNRLNYRLEQIQDSNPELARKYVQTVSDRWNQYHDEIRKLEDALSSSKGEYSKLIPEAINNLYEKWSAKYKRSINCNNPRGFSQRAHCQGRKKK